MVGAGIALVGSVATAYGDSHLAARAAAAPWLAARAASLSHDRTLSYPLEQVWPTTLRYLKVDRGYTLVDRDAEAGFILFDIPVRRPGATEEQVAHGSIEMFATTDMAGRAAVKVAVKTDSGPSHLPHAIAEGLATKLRTERGAPVAPPAPSPAPPTPPTPPPGDGPLVDPP